MPSSGRHRDWCGRDWVHWCIAFLLGKPSGLLVSLLKLLSLGGGGKFWSSPLCLCLCSGVLLYKSPMDQYLQLTLWAIVIYISNYTEKLQSNWRYRRLKLFLRRFKCAFNAFRKHLYSTFSTRNFCINSVHVRPCRGPAVKAISFLGARVVALRERPGWSDFFRPRETIFQIWLFWKHFFGQKLTINARFLPKKTPKKQIYWKELTKNP